MCVLARISNDQGLRTEPIWGSCLAERDFAPGECDSSCSKRCSSCSRRSTTARGSVSRRSSGRSLGAGGGEGSESGAFTAGDVFERDAGFAAAPCRASEVAAVAGGDAAVAVGTGTGTGTGAVRSDVPVEAGAC